MRQLAYQEHVGDEWVLAIRYLAVPSRGDVHEVQKHLLHALQRPRAFADLKHGSQASGQPTRDVRHLEILALEEASVGYQLVFSHFNGQFQGPFIRFASGRQQR